MTPPVSPRDFHALETFEAERDAIFYDCWYLVGATSQLKASGDYVSCELSGVPVVVRNFSGELVALRNVCAHRQSLLVCKTQGKSASLKCPYHGWEYGADGLTRKIPAPKNFPHFHRDQYRLDRFPLETCGDLVFVRLSEHGPTLRQWLGSRFDMFQDWFSQNHWRHTMTLRYDYQSNWKIVVETALESYHIPSVHPHTFAEDPGEPRSDHEFFDTGTSFITQFTKPRFVDQLLKFIEQCTLRLMGIPFTERYEHHHVYPHLLISHTDSLSLVQLVMPRSTTTSAGLVLQFGRRAAYRNPVSQLAARLWMGFYTWLTKPILDEDVAIYPVVQAGVQGASRAGILGRCEERLYHAQQSIRDRLDQFATTKVALVPHSVSPTADSSPANGPREDDSQAGKSPAGESPAGESPAGDFCHDDSVVDGHHLQQQCEHPEHHPSIQPTSAR